MILKSTTQQKIRDTTSEDTLDFIYDRIRDRQSLSYEQKFARSDVHDARALSMLAVSRMRQIVRRGRDPRACLLATIAELEHLTTALTGAKL